MKYDAIRTPLGWMGLFATEKNLKKVIFHDHKPDEYALETNEILAQVKQQLEEYFNGNLTMFNLPLSPEGTAFQQEVWNELQQVPCGKTISYGKLAHRLGDPKKVRAVGRANGQNPIPVIIPCHRVIGRSHKLTGYSGGIERKKWLLKHEGALLL